MARTYRHGDPAARLALARLAHAAAFITVMRLREGGATSHDIPQPIAHLDRAYRRMIRAYAATEPPRPDPSHVCDRAVRRPLYDARGIFCTYVCNVCEASKRARYRADIFTNPDYCADEPIEGDC